MTDKNDVGLQAIAETVGHFANHFFKTVANDQPGNLISSPLSVQVVLAMAAYGARGPTAEQMRSSLRIPSNDETGKSGYLALIKILNAPTGVDLRIANKIYVSVQAVIKAPYKELTASKFLSSSQTVDFNDAAGTAGTINSWCEQQTNNRIKDLIALDSLTPDTMLVLVNAVYFKGQWETKFDPALTKDRAFHVDVTTTIYVPTMYIESELRFGNLPDLNARFIEIPYLGREVSMVIILPNEINGLGTVRDNLHRVDLNRSLQQSFPSDVELFLPKFKIESTLELKPTLQKMGMTGMFEDNADFSGIADTPLKVSKVIQKAFIEINEEGSEAAAVTAMVMTLECIVTPTPLPVTFKIDRPFYYAIYHESTRIPLFTGIVHVPSMT